MQPLPASSIYDRPFFTFLWRDKADWPCLGLWVGDSSALLPMADHLKKR